MLACRNFLLDEENGDKEEVGQEGDEEENEDEDNGGEEEVRNAGVEEEGVEIDGLASGQYDEDLNVDHSRCDDATIHHDATVHDDLGIARDCTVVEREREGGGNENRNIVVTEILGCNDEENLFISDITEMCRVGLSSLIFIYLKLTSSA